MIKFIVAFSCAFCIKFNISGQDVVTFETFAEFEKNILKQNDTTYVINFWATWCKPCVKELPYFEDFLSKNTDKKIKVVLVSLDFRNQLQSHLIPFIQKNKFKSSICLLADKDYNRWLDKIDPDWSGSIPATLLLSGRKKHFEEREFESAVELASFVNTFIHSL